MLNVIEQQPSSGTKITDTERRFIVSRFPYGIIYTVDDNQITIFAVMNLKRKPGVLEIPNLESVDITSNFVSQYFVTADGFKFSAQN